MAIESERAAWIVVEDITGTLTSPRLLFGKKEFNLRVNNKRLSCDSPFEKRDQHVCFFLKLPYKVWGFQTLRKEQGKILRTKIMTPTHHLLLMCWTRFRLTTIPVALCVDRTRDYSGGISLYTEGILQKFLHEESNCYKGFSIEWFWDFTAMYFVSLKGLKTIKSHQLNEAGRHEENLDSSMIKFKRQSLKPPPQTKQKAMVSCINGKK